MATTPETTTPETTAPEASTPETSSSSVAHQLRVYRNVFCVVEA
jgi:hypothetical protein